MVANRQAQERRAANPEYAHRDITTTVFWVGEAAGDSNQYISNDASTWVEDWTRTYGGVDDPNNRCGFLPCKFTPKENPFYFALPYSDLDESCQPKPSQSQVPWFTGQTSGGNSIIKNQWIKIRHGDKIAYAQWEDAGPFGEDDAAYVFGDSPPNEEVGLDLSPATADYLGLEGRGKTDWEFVEEAQVANGPWRDVVTVSPPDCAK